jgi:hypothetical protein
MAILRGGLLLYREEAIGDVDGNNTVFISTYKFIPGTLVVKLNGLEQIAPDDYVELDDQTFEFVNPPIGGNNPDKIIISYQRA